MEGKQALIDMAYLGFGGEIETEREPISTFLKMGIPMSVCVSYSKTMALYKERAGALLMPTLTQEEARIVQEHLSRACARVTWSNPPAQGERVAGQVLTKPALLDSWKETLRFVAKTIADHRKALAQALGPDFAQIAEQAGLFSLLQLNDDAVTKLKDEDGIYLLPGGATGLARLSVMGIPKNQIARFAEAVHRVTRQ
jgi:aromatic-amino-acid transaminase